MQRAENLNRLLPHAIEWLDNLPTRLVVLVGILLLVLIGVLDHTTGYELSLSVFYLIPIALVSRRAGVEAGAFMSVMGAVTWLIADLASGHPYSHQLILPWNTVVRLAFFLIVSISLAHTRSLIESLKESTQTDVLTGIANWRGFRERAQLEMERSARYNRPLSIAYLDLDNFKEINDTLGHSAGDELLVKVAKVLKLNARNTDVVARLGGDEFAILLPETRPKLARRVIARFQIALARELKQTDGIVTASIGIVTFVSVPRTVDEMIRKADRLMYRAKRSGKNDSVFETYPISSALED